MNSDYFRLLLLYNRWANERVLDAASALDDAALTEAAGLSQTSILGALAHVLGSEMIWLARWEGESPPTILEADDFGTFAALRTAWAAHDIGLETFVDALDDQAVDRIVEYRNTRGGMYSNSLGQLIGHVVNHGTQFRSEAGVALSRRGQSPGDVDLIAFMRGRDA